MKINNILITLIILTFTSGIYLYIYPESQSKLTQNLKKQQTHKINNIQQTDFSDFLPNWMGNSLPVIGDLNFLDISVPGTHDTLTYDLSEVFSDNSNDVPSQISYILHNIVSRLYTFGKFGQSQARTQTLNIKQQLDNGVRFIDYRAVYTQDSPLSLTKNWYSLHFMQSKQKLIDLTKQIREWMDDHPKEVIVFDISYHGGSFPDAETTKPLMDSKQMQKFWKQFQELFEDIMYNTNLHKPLNQLTLNELIQQNIRVIVYCADWENFTGSSPYAQSQSNIQSSGDAGVYKEEDAFKQNVEYFQDVKQINEQSKKDNKYLKRSLATSSTDQTVLTNFVQEYYPQDESNFREEQYQKCVEEFNIPLNEYCPFQLRDLGQLNNYYHQFSLSIADIRNYQFPNSIILDQLDFEGTIRTGIKTNEYENYENYNKNNQQDKLDSKFAYSSIIIASNYKKVCNLQNPSKNCQKLLQIVNENINKYPKFTWDQPEYGRLKYWPSFD